MNKIIIPLAIAAAAAIPTAAHADFTASCDSVTATADPGTRVFVGLDDEPPYTLEDGGPYGTSYTFKFDQQSADPTETHWYTVTVLDMTTSAQISFANGALEGCGTVPFPVAELVAAPVVESARSTSVPTVEPREVLAVRRLANRPW